MKGNRPRIGVTSGFVQDPYATRLGLDYTGGLEEAGGLPLILPVPHRLREGAAGAGGAFAGELAAQALAAVDGLLLSGGKDLDPETFGEAPLRGLGEVEPERDLWELALARNALARGLPVFGICRGVQVLAVAAGGDLYQDLPSQKPDSLKHRQEAPRSAATHYVEVAPGTLLAGLLGSGPVKVNSLHHQAVRRVPAGFRVCAVAPDGVIEAIETDGAGRGRPFALGVQWHPEDLWKRQPVFLRLFAGLVDAARPAC